MSIIQDLLSEKYIVAKDGKELGAFETVEEARAFWATCPENPNVFPTPTPEAEMPTPTPSVPKKKVRRKK